MDEASSRFRPAPSAKFFFAVSRAHSGHLEALHQLLEERIGRLEAPSTPYLFSRYSRYYDEELGGEVWKYFVALERLLPADRLVAVKHATEKVQEELAREDGTRTVNIDPGYVNGWQLVLATVKNHPQRLYLGSGVFAEVTLLFHHGAFEALPWTYPDYRSPEVLAYFEALREGAR